MSLWSEAVYNEKLDQEMYKKMAKQRTKAVVRTKRDNQSLWRLYRQDCLTGIPQQIKKGEPTLAIYDVPYNIGQPYDDYHDSKDQQEFLAYLKPRFQRTYDYLHPHGSFWIAINDDNAAEIKLMCQAMGFHFRRWVIWHFTFGQNGTKNMTLSHVHWLYFTKHRTKFTYNAADPNVRIPSARQLVYNDKRANSKGRLPNDVWMLRPQEMPEAFDEQHDCWYFPRVCGTFHAKQKGLPNQIPIPLTTRIVRMCSKLGDLVIDGFCGTSSTGIASVLSGRRYTGFDLSAKCIQASTKSLKAVEAQGMAAVVDADAAQLELFPTKKKGKKTK